MTRTAVAMPKVEPVAYGRASTEYERCPHCGERLRYYTDRLGRLLPTCDGCVTNARRARLGLAPEWFGAKPLPDRPRLTPQEIAEDARMMTDRGLHQVATGSRERVKDSGEHNRRAILALVVEGFSSTVEITTAYGARREITNYYLQTLTRRGFAAKDVVNVKVDCNLGGQRTTREARYVVTDKGRAWLQEAA